ncbi:methylase [Blastocladiella britannica]|nr:methylase [Blastocladiella britannica]
MLPTPDFSHLKADDYDHVYEPAEDTFLFLDALEDEMDTVLRPLNPAIALEIGSGSGCVSSFLAMHLKTPTLYITTDINPRACDATARTGSQNKVAINPILTSLTGGLMPRLARSVDVLLFNPPYVPTPDEEVGTPDISAAWAGGIRGRRVIDQVIPLLDVLLSDWGVAYFVFVKENDVPEITEWVHREWGIVAEQVKARRSGPEHLSIVRFRRQM